MAVSANADLYAAPRQNMFFKGVIPALDGQCVSLVKWFMQDMSDVPNPQAPRGDAKNVGNTLVNQGHAVEVPFSQRKRGDLICYEYGTYGHISVQLSNGRVFEENVNWPGVASKIVDGQRVYASRIGNEGEAWRVGKNPHIYRLKTYKEDSTVKPTKKETWKTRRNYVLTEDTYILEIPSGKKGGEILHKKGEVLDIGEYTEWPNGKKFYRTKKQIADKDQRGYGKSVTIRAEVAPLKSVTFE